MVIDRDGDELELRIEDNGRGLDLARTASPDRDGTHQGLGNMQARAVAMGGRLAIAGGLPSGTRIIVRVPTATSDR